NTLNFGRYPKRGSSLQKFARSSYHICYSNHQAAILQFDEVASPLLLEDLHTEEREAVVEVVMCMSNAFESKRLV
ncbi:unnamed protein product, partial [Brassica rapa]